VAATDRKDQASGDTLQKSKHFPTYGRAHLAYISQQHNRKSGDKGMSENSSVDRLERAARELELKLRRQLIHMEEGYARIDQMSGEHNDLWAGRIYQRLIDRQNRVIAALFSR